ncbi:MAG: hypothetical protein CMJ34_00895 [Phycisphaerae bacterium]|nr:hypothetical protein [Phycisphaerae bacterium]
MKGPFTLLTTLLPAVLGATLTASAGLETPSDDVLSRLLRRPAGSGWVTTGDPWTPLWLGGAERTLPIGVIGSVERAPIADRLELTRTTLGITTTGAFLGRPEHRFGVTATIAGEPDSIGFPSTVDGPAPISFGIHHGWRLETDVHLRTGFGWKAGSRLTEGDVWAGLGLRFEF